LTANTVNLAPVTPPLGGIRPPRPPFGRLRVVFCALLFLTNGLYAQERNPRLAVTGALDWKNMKLTVNMTLDIASAGIRLPAGRSQAEDIISSEFPGLLRPYILAIPVDSSTVVEDLVRQGELPYLEPETLANSAKRGQTTFTPDFTSLSASYTLDLLLLSGLLIMHKQASEIRRVPIPQEAPSYTGIVIIATGELPVHGRKTAATAATCLFPKIWDTDMNLVYDRNTLDPDSGGKTLVYYAAEEDIFRDNPSGLSPELAARVGNNPLKIIARGIFGIRPTDPVIHRDDALVIISSENNRLLLREGNVAIVLGNDALNPPPLKTAE
jgi:hypothetical protein